MNPESFPRSLLATFGGTGAALMRECSMSIPEGATVQSLEFVSHTPAGPRRLAIFDAGDLGGIGAGCACGMAPFGLGLGLGELHAEPEPEDEEPSPAVGRVLTRWALAGMRAELAAGDGLTCAESAAVQWLADMAAEQLEAAHG